MQSSALLGLRLDMDVTHEIDTDSEAQRLLLPIQLLMIVQLQLMNFHYLKVSMQYLMFALNPISWIDIMHPSPGEWVPDVAKGKYLEDLIKTLVHPSMLAPWPCVAMLFRGAIGYWVSVDSVSIILKCETVSDAIFNSLAITFIADLNEPYWEGLCSCLGLQIDEGFQWCIHTGAWKEDELSKDEKDRLKYPCIIEGLAKRCSFLRRDKGFALVEDMTTFVALFVIYLRQLFVVAFALKTNVLPAARDVCTMWRWHEGESKYMLLFAKMCLFFTDYLSLVDTQYGLDKLTEEMEERTEHPCETKYRRMMRSDAMELLHEYGWPLGLGIAFIATVLFGRRLMKAVYRALKRDAAPRDAVSNAASET